MLIQDHLPPQPSKWEPREEQLLLAHTATFAPHEKPQWKKIERQLREDLPRRTLSACQRHYNDVLKKREPEIKIHINPRETSTASISPSKYVTANNSEVRVTIFS